MSNDRLKYLLEQYAEDASTKEETKELFGWIKESKDDALLKDKIKELWHAHNNAEHLPDVDWNTIYEKIISTPVISKRPVWPRIAAAAIILLLLSAASYFIFNDHAGEQVARTEMHHKDYKNDVGPGGNKAILTLANGKQIILDNEATGTLTQQGNTKIIKLDSGRLVYNSLNEKPNGVLYNTISTPRGGQYEIVLADGSKVWLDAASSLRFPTSFTGKERKVELTGEGYFEVAHNADMPFRVIVNSMQVEVLGTHFNINAYSDEKVIKTTLLQGSVEVRRDSFTRMIKPGEQAQVSYSPSGTNDITVRKTDVDAAVAWKNGRFIFQGNNIQSVMRELSRWYNVDVSYQGNVTDEEFVGVINRSRYENISQILEMLERTRTVSFAINGHSIIVMPFKE